LAITNPPCSADSLR